MNEDYGYNSEQKEKETENQSYYGKYTESSTEGQSYAYKTVMDGVPRSRGWSVASMVLGILSIVCCCLDYGGLIMGVLAILFAIISRRNLGYFDGMAIAGLVIGIVGTVFGLVSLVIGIYLNLNPEILESYLDYLRSLYPELEDTLPGTTDGF